MGRGTIAGMRTGSLESLLAQEDEDFVTYPFY